MTEPTHLVERTLVIGAPRATVFAYFTDRARFAAWWGQGSDIEARPGGRVLIRYPNGVLASGEVLEIEPPRRIVFTYGYEEEGKRLRPGASRVTVELSEEEAKTRLHLRHELPTQALRDEYVQGWRYQLALFANVVAREVHSGAARRLDEFFSAWSEEDAAERYRLLASCAAPEVSYRDAFSCTVGIEDLSAQLAAFRLHMPGVRLAREGEVRQCQGTALAAWIARAADGSVRARGQSVLELAPDGRIRGVVSFWA